MRFAILAALGATGALAGPPAAADDLQTLRDEIAQMKHTYEQRIAALEARLAQAEATRAAAPTTAEPNDRLGQTGSANAFNPQISLILDGVYYRDNRQGKGPALYEAIDGINHGHGHGDHGELERGFNLRETELVLSAAVSPYFNASAMMTVGSDGGIELEEAYFDSRSLPGGLKLRAGKFLSGIGYLNERHPHQWQFVDQNLPYQTLLGEHGMSDTGIRLNWLPKTGSWYTLLGVELLQGREHPFASAGLELPTSRADGAPLAASRAGGLAPAKSGPRLVTAFGKFAPDLGYRHALQFGLWTARTRQHQEVHDDSAEDADALAHALEGKSRTWGTDWVYKYDAGGIGGQGNLDLVAEYLRQDKDLHIAFHENGDLVGQKRRFVQDGYVVQGSYGILPHWQLGIRYDATGGTNRLDGPDGTLWQKGKSDRWTLALTRSLTEFSLLRFQFSRANLYVDGSREDVNQLFVQYQHSLGAHGAHSF